MATIVTTVAVVRSVATSSVAALVAPLDFVAFFVGNYHDLLHPNFLVHDGAKLVDPLLVPAPAGLDLAVIASSYFVVAAATTDDSIASVAHIESDFQHPSFLVDERAEFVAPVVAAPADLDFATIASNRFVVVAATTDDSIASVVDIELGLRHPKLLADVEVESFDFLTTAPSDFAVAAATPFDFGASALHIGFALGCSSLAADDAAAPFLTVAEREEKLQSLTRGKEIWFS